MASSNSHPDFCLKDPKNWAGTITVSMVKHPVELKQTLDSFVEIFTGDCNWSYQQRLDCGTWTWGTLVCYDGILEEGDATIALLSFFDQDGGRVGSEHTWLIPSTSIYDDVKDNTQTVDGESLRDILFDEVDGLEDSTQELTPFSPTWFAQHERLVNAHDRGLLILSPRPFNGHELSGHFPELPDVMTLPIHQPLTGLSMRYESAADRWSKSLFEKYKYDFYGDSGLAKSLNEELEQMKQDRYKQDEALLSKRIQHDAKQRVRTFEEFADLSCRLFGGSLNEPALHVDVEDTPGLSYFELKDPPFRDTMEPLNRRGMRCRLPAARGIDHASLNKSADSSVDPDSPVVDTAKVSDLLIVKDFSEKQDEDVLNDFLMEDHRTFMKDKDSLMRDDNTLMKVNDSLMEDDIPICPPSPRPAHLSSPLPQPSVGSLMPPPPLPSRSLRSSCGSPPPGLPPPSPLLPSLDDEYFEEEFDMGVSNMSCEQPKAKVERETRTTETRKPVPRRWRPEPINLNSKHIVDCSYGLLNSSFMYLEHRKQETLTKKRKKADLSSSADSWSSTVDWETALGKRQPSPESIPETIRPTGWRRSNKLRTYSASGGVKYVVKDSSPVAEMPHEFELGESLFIQEK